MNEHIEKVLDFWTSLELWGFGGSFLVMAGLARHYGLYGPGWGIYPNWALVGIGATALVLGLYRAKTGR